MLKLFMGSNNLKDQKYCVLLNYMFFHSYYKNFDLVTVGYIKVVY